MKSSGKDHEEKIINISQSLGVSVERVKVCKNLNNLTFNVNAKFSCAFIKANSYLTVLFKGIPPYVLKQIRFNFN